MALALSLCLKSLGSGEAYIYIYFCKVAYFVVAGTWLGYMLDIDVDVPVVSISWIGPNGGITTDGSRFSAISTTTDSHIHTSLLFTYIHAYVAITTLACTLHEFM